MKLKALLILLGTLSGLSACSAPPPQAGQLGYEGYVFNGQIRSVSTIIVDPANPATSKRVVLDVVTHKVQYGDILPGQLIKVQLVPGLLQGPFKGMCSFNARTRNPTYPHGIYVIDTVIGECIGG